MSHSSKLLVKQAAAVTTTVLVVCFAAWLLWRVKLALLIIAVSLLIAVALNHVVAWLEKRGWRRGLAIAAALLALLGAMVGVGWLVLPPLVAQIKLFLASWPDLLASFERSSVFHWLERHFDLKDLLTELRSRAPSLVGKAVSVVTTTFEVVGAGATVFFVVAFMLVSGRPMLSGLFAEMQPGTAKVWAETTKEAYHAVGGYVLGLTVIVFTQMVATSIWLLAFGVPYFLPLGVCSGLASLVPFAGAVVMGAIVSLIAWGTNGIWVGLATAVYYVVYQEVESHVLIPVVYRRTVRVNPLAILLMVLIMFDLAGVVGAILAVPITAAAHVILRALLARRHHGEGPTA